MTSGSEIYNVSRVSCSFMGKTHEIMSSKRGTVKDAPEPPIIWSESTAGTFQSDQPAIKITVLNVLTGGGAP